MKLVSTTLLLALSAIAASAAAPNARYVRVELPGKGKTLTLAEVEVISKGKNIAKSGKATQSSLGAGGVPERAIDGNKNPSYNSGGQTHTSEGKANPWWELDLGRTQAIDKVSIWNRGDGLEERLSNFTITLLDSNRKAVFKKDGLAAPKVSVDFDFGKKVAVTYRGGKGKVQKVARSVDVPAGYKDPAPFKFAKGDVVSIIGNGLADRMQHDGWMETLLQSEDERSATKLPQHEPHRRPGKQVSSFKRIHQNVRVSSVGRGRCRARDVWLQRILRHLS